MVAMEVQHGGSGYMVQCETKQPVHRQCESNGVTVLHKLAIFPGLPRVPGLPGGPIEPLSPCRYQQAE